MVYFINDPLLFSVIVRVLSSGVLINVKILIYNTLNPKTMPHNMF